MRGNIRIVYMSDLHLEFEWNKSFPDFEVWATLFEKRFSTRGHPTVGPYMGDYRGECDAVVVAGDTDLGTYCREYLDDLSLYLGVPVITIAGNHEYYGNDFRDLPNLLARSTKDTDGRVVFLNRARHDLMLHGCRVAFLGCTLWADFSCFEDRDSRHVMKYLSGAISDFRKIKFNQYSLRPEHVLAQHHLDVDWLRQAIPKARQEADLVIVVTHHGPSRTVLPADFRTDVAPSYVSNLDDLILETRPDAWIFGHIHANTETRIGTVPVLSTARGYVHVRNEAVWRFTPGYQAF